MSIYSGAVKKPVTTALCFIAIIILGMFSYSQLAVDLLPQIDANAVLVMTSYPGASANDIEMNVSRPIENGLNGVADLKHITSISRENISIVALEFEYGIDIDVATNDIRDKLDLVKSALPDDANSPILFKFGADDIPIIILSATAEESTNALYKVLDDKVANPLARISGVGTVSIGGAAQREIQVYCDPFKLDAYGMTIESIAQLIGMENRNTPGGTVDLGTNTLSLRVQGEFNDAQEMLDLVIGSSEGKAIYLRDVARVEDTVQERSSESYTSGNRGATIIIQKQSGANSVQIAKEVHKRLPEIQKTLPSDVQLGMVIDTSENIMNTMDSLQETIMITLIIVMLVVFVFLGRWRATIIIGITIPVSLIGAFIYLLVTGNTLNIISLSSLSLAIGMVVDDSIVVLENITTHINRGSKPRQAAIYGTQEVSLSVIASTLTMLAVFIPLTMISGMAGVLFRQLGGIISIIMVISTVAALTLIPMMASQMLKLDTKKGKLYTLFFTPIDKVLGALENGYAKLLGWAVHHRWTVVAIAIGIFGGSLLLVPTIKTEFFPTQDNGRISLKMELPVGTRQDITRQLAKDVSDELMQKYPEIEILNYSLGQADADNVFANLGDNGTHMISYNIKLCSIDDRQRGLTEICDLMRRDLDKYTALKEYQVIAGGATGGAGGESSVDIEIYGYDFSITDNITAQLSEKLKQIPECSQVTISRGDYVPELEVEFDRQKLALNGLNVTTVSSFLRNRVNGTVASYFREDGEEYDIRIRYAPEYRESIETIENIIVYNPAGQGVRIRDLGRVVEKMTPPTIERKDRERIVTVSATVAKGYVLSDLVQSSEKVLSGMDIPTDMHYRIGGTYEQQQETFGDLTMLLVLIIILVFIVMAAQFESLVDPFVIMFSIPFTFTGVFLGLSVTGTPLGVMAMIGILILMGVVVKNGIVLVDYIKLCRERGLGIIHAVITSGKSRLRPVLMTTLTTVLGMLPMALGTGEGSEMWRSMGMTVAWGLSISTLITLVLIPVLYCMFASREMKRKRKQLANVDILEVRIEDI
ncbi:efflux RND transporter permease subunit [Bacteroides sp. OttesenSCG-928-D19]|nr:efflux RND transporter permease subunit [Bacteroides sp. OttesenSCG-928-N06]MDL2304223.1 efflux RND transporter permease subunit [Bacteroides sp. OttesenSCG-928-D19]